MIGKCNVSGGNSTASIAVTHAPTKTSYKDGETLNLSGMVVTATKKSGSTETVTDYITVPANGVAVHEGNSSIVIVYDGCVTLQAITISPKIAVKSFASATDAELRTMVEALDAGYITTSDLNWKVGDFRSVSLSGYSGSKQLVILNIGGKTFKGNGTSLDNTTCHYVVGFKDNVTVDTWSEGENYEYPSSTIKARENEIYNSLPSDVKACFKKFNVVTGQNYNNKTEGGTNYTSQQYFTSPAEKEVFGSRTYSTTKEANALTQFTYYATADNRKHSSRWWTRSIGAENYYCACGVDSTSSSAIMTSMNCGVAPYGCM